MRNAISVLVAVIVASCGGAPVGTQSGATAPGTSPASATSAPIVTPAPTATPAGPSVVPASDAPGIATWTIYTSTVYGITFGYPDGWAQEGAATRRWQEGDVAEAPHAVERWSETFANPEARDGDQIGLRVWQRAAGAGSDVTSREGLSAWFAAQLCDDEVDACGTVSDLAIPLCYGQAACLPAILVPLSDSTQAVFADPAGTLVTIVSLGRPDDFPATSRYGGAIELMKSILTTMDVWTPKPAQIRSGT